MKSKFAVVTFLSVVLVNSLALTKPIPDCRPDKEPTKTPHCVIKRYWTADQKDRFHLYQQPYGTCEEELVTGGHFLQIVDHIEYLSKGDPNYPTCATIVLVGEIEDHTGTPFCFVKSAGEAYVLYQSSTAAPLLSAPKIEFLGIVEKIERHSSICGQGVIWELEFK